MPLNVDVALRRAASEGDGWQAWRARRMLGEPTGEMPFIPAQDEVGGFVGPGGGASPGATGEALCHFVILGTSESGAATIAADWLEEVRTPAEAWLDSPDEVPGTLDTPAAGRVWATGSAACGLLCVGRDPGARALDLLRGEADLDGRLTGGAYPTFAAAGAYWAAQGAKTEMSEWALRWAREAMEEWWGPWEWATALTFWGAAGVPPEHPTVDAFLEQLRSHAPTAGWNDLGLTLRTLELLEYFG